MAARDVYRDESTAPRIRILARPGALVLEGVIARNPCCPHSHGRKAGFCRRNFLRPARWFGNVLKGKSWGRE